INGGAGNDTITGGSGNDILIGGSGNDTYLFDTDNALGSDTINESDGRADTLDLPATTTRALPINLGNAAAQVIHSRLTLLLSAVNTIDNVIGATLGDNITATALNTVTLHDALPISINGGAGNDTITGGSGNDMLIGGSGNDTYLFDTDNALGSDTIN